jgi:2-polyprenyl-6-methoxyphenol hydroxylase-like FAD-dependent oxidoreductase
VGADGAYSAVRQRLYDRLRNEGKLPKGDQEELPFSCTCLVGQTRVLDPKAFPFLEEEKCQVVSVLSDNKPFTVGVSCIRLSYYDRLQEEDV